MPAKLKRKAKMQSLPAGPYEPTAKDARAVPAFKAVPSEAPVHALSDANLDMMANHG